MNIVKEDYRLRELKNIETMIENSGKLYIWGFSQTAKMITAFLKRNSNLKIEGYIVDDAYYEQTKTGEGNVYCASAWKNLAQEGDYVIFGFVGSERAEEIKKSLPKGVSGVYFSFPYSANVDGFYITADYYNQFEERFLETYDCLYDEASKKIMAAFLTGCISGDTRMLEQLKTEGQYFNELTKECKSGSFLDLGAYTGDTIESAFEFLGNRAEKVYAFEPDHKNIERLRNRINARQIPERRWELIPKGSWSHEAVLHFSSSDSSSSISEEGDMEIKVDSVDRVLLETDMPVAFIKMDVEGSELESLQGAAKTIQKNYPILAVCVYHKPEDLYTLPEMIKSLTAGRDYRFYLRYHGPDLRELVFYAIPE